MAFDTSYILVLGFRIQPRFRLPRYTISQRQLDERKKATMDIIILQKKYPVGDLEMMNNYILDYIIPHGFSRLGFLG